MLQINGLIDHYNEFAFTDDLGRESWDILSPTLSGRKLVFGDRPLCTAVRPLFHTRRGWHFLREHTELILSVFRKATEAMLEDQALRAQLHLTPAEEQFIQIPTGYKTNIPTARLDSFYCRHNDGRINLDFVEFNYEGFPFVDVTGGLSVGRRLVDCDPFLFHGDMVGGCLVRLSNLTLLNVTAGGSIIPAFIVDEL